MGVVILAALLKIIFMFALIMLFVVVLIWAERKGSAFIQDRTGPNRAEIGGIRLAGLVHPVADVLKLLFKEDVVPTQRHKVLYALAPMLVMVVAVSTYAVIPFGDYIVIGGQQFSLVVADLSVGMLYVLAISSLATYGVVLGGWASNSKYTFLGAMRSSAQMISYEITMGLALLSLFLVFGSFRLTEITAAQGDLIWGWLPAWGVVVQPVGFLLFLAAVYAECNRTPFDLAERDSEIVAGYHLEYSSMKFALFFMAEYAHMVVAAALISALYFRRAARERGRFGDARDREPLLLGVQTLGLGLVILALFLLKPWTVGAAGASLFASLIQVVFFVAKVMFFAWLFIWVRWTVPSFRYDQLMRLGWKIMLPAGLANLVVTALWVAAVN